MPDTHALYLFDLGYLIREEADEAKRANAAVEEDRAYQRGKLMAYNEVISLMHRDGTIVARPKRRSEARRNTGCPSVQSVP